MRRIVLVAMALAACRTGQGDRAAVIVNPTPASRAALEGAVTAALGKESVPLADDALTQDSVLYVEHVRLRDPSGQLADGRDRRRPESFRLVTSDGRCVLVHEASGKRYELADTACAAK